MPFKFKKNDNSWEMTLVVGENEVISEIVSNEKKEYVERTQADNSSLKGFLKENITLAEIKEERLKKYENPN